MDAVYLAMSALTGKPFLSPRRKAACFYSKSRAEKAFEEIPAVYFEGPLTDFEEIKRRCYAAGAIEIELRSDTTSNISLSADHTDLGHLNPKANGLINILKEYSDPKLLRHLSKCSFIVPVNIRGENMELITYALAESSKGEKRYLLFTDEGEYSLWAREPFKPLLLSYNELWEIGHKCGFIVNVSGNMFFLPPELLPEVKTEV